MMRFIMPIVLIGIAISVFLVFTDPLYSEMNIKKAEVASYDEALNNANMLESERDKLTKKFSAINPDNLVKLQKLLPENVDNIRLILEIEKIASPHNMVLRDVKYDTLDKEATPSDGVQGGSIKLEDKGYGIFNLEFSTSGSYNNLISFIKDLESNLRIVDISAINFTSEGLIDPKTKTFSEIYKYDFKIKTYWLKN